jgi:Protein of unknown function (DUF3168)
MSIETQINALLSPIVPTYPDFAPNNAPYPYAIWYLIGGPLINPIGNEVPNKRGAFLQIDVWSTTREQANSVSKQIDSAMRQTTAFQARPMSEIVSKIDEDTGLRCATQDFRIWADR